MTHEQICYLDAFSGTYTDPTHPETDPGDRSEILLNDGPGLSRSDRF